MPDTEALLVERRLIAQSTYELSFDVSGCGYVFRPGQYADFTLSSHKKLPAEETTRTFSFVNPFQDNNLLTIAYRYRPSPYKRRLTTLPLGSKITITSAIGAFDFPADHNQPVVCIAGGIGIVPFMSLIADSINRLPRPIILFYSNQTLARAAYLNRLVPWHETSRLKLIMAITRQQCSEATILSRRLERKSLIAHAPNYAKAIFYIAGPPHMTADMTELVANLGVPLPHIHVEAFSGY